jgi:hypothetical protein
VTSASMKSGENRPARKYIGVHFRCCNIYYRIYRNSNATAYEGYCPKCHKKVYIKIGESGVQNRFFEAY